MRRLVPWTWFVALLAAMAVLAAAAPAPAAVRLNDHVQFQPVGGQTLDNAKPRGWEVEIDQDLEVTWVDQAALLTALRAQLPEGPPPPDLDEQIAAIRQIGENLVRAQALFAQAAQQRLASDEAAATATEEQAADLAIESLEAATALEDRAPAAYAQMNALLEARSPIQQRYAALGQLLGESLASIAHELARSAQQLEVRMEAHVAEPGGVEEPVLVRGYYEPHDRGRYPFARFQAVIDERTRRDLAAVDAAAAVIRPLRDEAARTAMRTELVALRDALVAACDQVRSTMVEPRLRELQTQLQALIASDPAVKQTVADVEQALETLRRLRRLGDALQPATLSGLASLLDQFGDDLQVLAKDLEGLPAQLVELAGRVQALAARAGDALSADVRQALVQFASTLPEVAPRLAKLVEDTKLLATRLGIAGAVDAGASAAESAARQLTTTADLATTIVPASARQRRPGDLLHVRAWIVPREADPQSAPLASEEWAVRLSVIGWTTELRGALLFADPRSAGAAPGQRYEVATALGCHARYGIKGASFWNNVLAPGLGVSLALLDFEDGRDFEVGIAGSATLLHDLLWAGYGRNLQAACDYFYVGVNPLALVELGKRMGR